MRLNPVDLSSLKVVTCSFCGSVFGNERDAVRNGCLADDGMDPKKVFDEGDIVSVEFAVHGNLNKGVESRQRGLGRVTMVVSPVEMGISGAASLYRVGDQFTVSTPVPIRHEWHYHVAPIDQPGHGASEGSYFIADAYVAAEMVLHEEG